MESKSLSSSELNELNVKRQAKRKVTACGLSGISLDMHGYVTYKNKIMIICLMMNCVMVFCWTGAEAV